MSIKHREDSITGIRKREAQQTKIAESAVLTDGSIHLTLPGGHVCDGTTVKFCAPCSCDKVTGGIVIEGETYTVVDTMRSCITGIGGVWDVGAQLSIVIDDTNKRAFLQNGDHILILNEPPTSSTVAKIGQHAICDSQLYVCVAHIANGTETKYVWHIVTTKKLKPDLLTVTTNQTVDLSALGLKVGDEVTVACVSGGNGGKKAGGAGGAAGKGGSASGTSSSFGGGGGAGAGYGAGGGGGGGNGSNNTNNTGGQGGQGGNCEIGTYEITSTSVSVTIGAAGTASGGNGGTTSFGSYVSVTGGGGSAGGSGGNGTSMNPGGGGGGGGGWYLVEGNTSPTHYGAGSNGVAYNAGRNGGNGGGYGNGAGAGGAAGKDGGDTTIGAGHGVVYIWY